MRMICTSPLELDDEQLFTSLRALNPELDQQKNPYVEGHDTEQAALQSLLTYQNHCPTAREIEKYYLAELSRLQEDAIAHHLASGCQRCKVVVASVMAEFESLVAPPDQQTGLFAG